MERALGSVRVAVLATDGVERVELEEPWRALLAQGARLSLVAPHERPVRSIDHHTWAKEFPVDCASTEAIADDYDALVLPGGVMSPDALRMDPDAVRLVRDMAGEGKLVAAICHAPWLLIEAGVVRGRIVTSFESVRTDLVNAGAQWVDEAVVIDRNLVTSRSPADLPAFCATIVARLTSDAARRVRDAGRRHASA